MDNNIKYSVIIPTLNEEAFIAKCIESAQNNIPGAEIIIADGRSADSTIEICKSYKVKIVSSSKGRGIQLNDGAKAASGDVLIFLHADTLLPDNAHNLIVNFFISAENKICRFLLGFDFNHKLLDLYTKFSKYDDSSLFNLKPFIILVIPSIPKLRLPSITSFRKPEDLIPADLLKFR